MRLIGTLENENEARRFAAYLKRLSIDNTCDVSFDATTGHMSYQIWVIDEDRIEEARRSLETFLERPSDVLFDAPITEQIILSEETPILEEPVPRYRSYTPFTTFILALCSFLFLFQFSEEYSMAKEGFSQKTLMITPIQSLLLFDVPPAFVELEALIEENQIPMDQKIEELSPEIQGKIRALSNTPFWQGIYEWILLKAEGKDPSVAEGPLFQKIREGEVWRFISPVVLHRDLLHILFNMLWVWVLSRPIEQRIGFFRLALLSLICGVGSNTLQYLMSGPFFIGYSGIVMGLAGFTWMREKVAPWEGYPLERSTTLFLLIFVGGMCLLQLSSFLLQIFTSIAFEPNIANTAHIAGACLGALLGKSRFFNMRVSR